MRVAPGRPVILSVVSSTLLSVWAGHIVLSELFKNRRHEVRRGGKMGGKYRKILLCVCV